jgi:hypothetical protein
VTPAALPALFVWGVWAVMAAGLAVFVGRFGLNVPFWDEWAVTPWLTGDRPVTAEWLWYPHAEHRIPVAKLALLALSAMTGGDSRAGMWLSVALISAAAAGMILAARRLSPDGRTAWTDAAFPLLLMHWGQADNLLGGFHIAVTIPAALSAAAILLAATGGPAPSAGRVAAVGALSAAMPLCGVFGLAQAPGLAVLLAMIAVRGGGAGRIAAAGAALTVASAAAYLVGFGFEGERPPFDAGAALRTAGEFLAVGFGPAASARWPASGWAAAGLMVLSGVAAAFLAFRREPHRPRADALALAVGIGNVVALAAAIGVGRSVLGPGAGFGQRYATLAAAGPCLALLTWRWADLGRAQWVAAALRWAILAATAAALLPNAGWGLHEARRREAFLRPFEADLRAGWPTDALVLRHGGELFVDAAALAERIEMLRRARLGPFRGMPAGADAEPVPGLRVRPLVTLAFPPKPVEPVEQSNAPISAGRGLRQEFTVSEDGRLMRLDVQFLVGPRRGLGDRLAWVLRSPSGEILRRGELEAAGLRDWWFAELRPAEPLPVRRGERLVLELSASESASAEPVAGVPIWRSADPDATLTRVGETAATPVTGGCVRGFVLYRD